MSFALDISKFAEHAKSSCEEARRAVVIELCSSVIEATPVLSGRLRGDWRSSVKMPITETTGRIRSEAEAKAEMEAAAKSISGDDPMFLRNNLPYANRIEWEGWSHTKRPEGMVRVNLARIKANLSNFLRTRA